MNACTIIAWNYLAHARVLAKSFLAHHRQGRFTVLLLDDAEEELRDDGEAFRIVRPREILPSTELDRMSVVYDVTELATAVKARFLSHLLDEGDPAVVFFDPDVQVFAPLDDVFELARRHAIVLTPHGLEPLPRDGRRPSELSLLQSGAYNLGFLALGKESRSFLTWWSERLRLHCLAAPEQGLFVDQKWVDLVPGYFDHYILKDPGCNVAYWNLSRRPLTRANGSYRIEGRPLRFFHFSGFDPGKPHLLSRHAVPAPRVLLSERPLVRELCDAYARALAEEGYAFVAGRAYGLATLANGVPIDRRMRRLYRDALLELEEGRGDEPPSPRRDPDAFVEWLNEPLSRRSGVSRYLHAVYRERADLRGAFPDLEGEDGARYLAWVRTTGACESIPAAFVPEARHPQQAPERENGALRSGVNVIGYFRAELGVGEAARLLLFTLEHAGIPYRTITLDDAPSRQQHPFSNGAEGGALGDVDILCVNADALTAAVKRLGGGRYTIGLWHWELSAFPGVWDPAFERVDEIWAASEHAAEALRLVAPRPVYVVPPAVVLDEPPRLSREELGLPERFAFLFVYDFLSVCERKNPLGLLEAFTRAFAPGEGPVLVLKSINGGERLEALERVKLKAAERDDVLVVDEYFSREKTLALLASCDAYVSLHRAEGFGLTMAEAMALGKPVVATGYSGNLTFMSEETAYLVRYRLTRVPEGVLPYPAGAEWAEPDVEEAARLLRRVYERPDEAQEKGRRAREVLRERHSVAARAELVAERLASARARLGTALDGPAEPETSSSERAPTKHELAHARAQGFPASPWEATRRLRPALPAARAALHHLLRPYTASLQALHAAMLDDALELRERFDRHVRESRGAFLETTAALEETTGALDRRIALLSEQTLPAVRRRAVEGTERIVALEDRLARLESHLEKLVRDVTGFQDIARSQLASLTEHARGLEASLEGLERELHALPYTAEPAVFGTEGMGYRSGSRASRDKAELYAGFQAVFRGPEGSVRELLRPYVEIVRAHSPVLDVGCGRGELLDLLAEAGVPAVGIDVRASMVDRCREKGHRVERAEAAAYLGAQPDDSLGCVFSAHVVEHLTYEALSDLLRLSREKVVPGGLFVAETVNPHSVAAMKLFWLDPSHERPLFPEATLTLCRLHGFEEARIVFPRGCGRFEIDVRKQGEYAVLARRG